jgi:hypothetical protein
MHSKRIDGKFFRFLSYGYSVDLQTNFSRENSNFILMENQITYNPIIKRKIAKSISLISIMRYIFSQKSIFRESYVIILKDILQEFSDRYNITINISELLQKIFPSTKSHLLQALVDAINQSSFYIYQPPFFLFSNHLILDSKHKRDVMSLFTKESQINLNQLFIVLVNIKYQKNINDFEFQFKYVGNNILSFCIVLSYNFAIYFNQIISRRIKNVQSQNENAKSYQHIVVDIKRKNQKLYRIDRHNFNYDKSMQYVIYTQAYVGKNKFKRCFISHHNMYLQDACSYYFID